MNGVARRALMLLLLAVAFFAPGLCQTAPERDVILRAMSDELERSKALKVETLEGPYFIEYGVFDGRNVTMSAMLGSLIGSRTTRYRLPRVQVRVGNYKFDNTNFISSDFFSGTRYDVDQLPLEDSYGILRHHLWLATDAAYKGAVEAISRKRAALQNMNVAEQQPDFSRAEPVRIFGEITRREFPERTWAARVERLSALFTKFPQVRNSSIDLQFSEDARYLLNSEGTRIRAGERMVMLRARADGQAPDGMLVRDATVFLSLDPDRMPSDVELERGVRQLAENVTALVQAGTGESYSGPVLFEGIAGPQIMAEVLGKNLVIPRRPVAQPGRPLPFQASELDGRLGVRILPEWMDVVDDPTQGEWRGRPLFGHYAVDLEGVVPRPLQLVEKGVLKGFLLTRQPVKNGNGSNGRARLPGNFGARIAGFGNLFVRASQTVPPADLKKKLIDLCRERNKPYGIIVRKMDFPSSAPFDEVRRILTGSMQSGGSRPVSVPLLMYKVFPDGREELLRGLRFKGLTTRSLKDIVAASDETYTYDFLDNAAPFALMGATGFVAETSVIAPSILIDDLELERPQEELPKLPIVPPPPLQTGEVNSPSTD